MRRPAVRDVFHQNLTVTLVMRTLSPAEDRTCVLWTCLELVERRLGSKNSEAKLSAATSIKLV